MNLNEKQKNVIELVKEGKNVFITGSAGTGKSYILKYITNYLRNVNKKYAITALTGCAAILINGQTIHSYLCLGLNNNSATYVYNKYKNALKKINNLNVIIIDEISMMDSDLLEKINKLLCLIKNNKYPFGGIQIIFIGDFCQLPPINGMYCFQNSLWNELKLNTIILTEIMRQKDDNNFQLILEEIRKGKCSNETYKILKSLKNTTFDNDIKPTRLYPINVNVDLINTKEFNKLKKENDDFTITYNSYSSENSNIDLKNYNITLTKNAQVIITRNISIDDGLYNGTRGVVVELNENNIIIKDINNKIHIINYYKDINENNNKIWISFLPIKLAYALSIHKSQGSTIDALEIDLGRDIFVSGQLYTALSRAKSLKSIKIINISKSSFMINNEVKKFYCI